MKNHSETSGDWEKLRENIIGLGEKSFKKSYYPELQRRIEELEKITGDFELINDKLIKKNLELKESEERYRLLFENVWDVVFLYDSEFSIISVSPSVERILGYKPEELTGRKFLDINIIAPEYLDAAVSDASRLLAGEKIPSAEYEFIAKDGTRKTGEVSGSLVLRNGEIIGVISIGRDITERKNAEKLINHQREELARTNMELRAAMEELEASNEELIQSNAQLTESEERYRSLFEGVPIGLYRATHDGRIVEVNRVLVAMLGYPDRQSLLAVNARDLYANPGDRERWLSLFERKNIVRNYDIQFRRHDGSIIWARNNGRVVRDESRRILCYEGSLEDITDLKQVEKELHETEQKLHDIFQGSPIPAFIINTSHQVIYWNRALEEMSGIKSGEVMDTCLHWKAFYGEARPCMADLLLDGDAAAITFWYNGKYRRSDLIENAYEATDFFPNLGEGGKWLRFTAAVIRGASGDPLGALETLEDITKRKLAEDALRESEEKYKTLVNNIPDIVYSLDRSGKITLINKEVLDAYGYRYEDLINEPFPDFIHPDDKERVSNSFIEAVKTHRNYTKGLQFRIVDKKGDIHWLELHSHMRFDNQGDFHQEEGVLRDISERKLADEKLLASLHEKEVLLKEVHHRVKNNLQVIMSLINLQSKNLNNKDLIQCIDVVKNRIWAISLIHERLYQSGNFSSIDFPEYIKILATELCRAYYQTTPEINFTLDAGNVGISIDKAIPCSLITNEIISNSLKHAFPPDWHGKAELSVSIHEDPDGRVELTIRDNGIGIPLKAEPGATDTLGLNLINILTRQIDGKFRIDRENGTKYTIIFNKK